MSDASRITRNGKVSSGITYEKLKTSDGGGSVPYCFFSMMSDIDIGGETIEEVTNVLAIGESMCEYVRQKDLQIGDEICVIAAVCYVRGGALCVRPSSADQLSVSRGENITFGLSKKEFIEAKTYFSKRK